MQTFLMKYESIIGIETHVQLNTHTKLWCGCANQYGCPPNTHVCSICLGLPGVLPVANEEALRLTALTGMLLHSSISKYVRFDRKNYFYPDVPKNYQITQLAHPSCQKGYVEFEFEDSIQRVNITRAHLEEDVGKSRHFDQCSGVDYNRAGVPLLEIISEPELQNADMAYAYLNALVALLRCGKISDCDMEKGMLRCDVNISVKPKGQKSLGAKTELKNMNSLSAIRRAISYEVQRQIEALEKGLLLHQETRRWDDITYVSEVMRSKEDAHDYRYFPDPDLVPFEPNDAWFANIKAHAKDIELPLNRKRRLMLQYSIPEKDAAVFASDIALGDYFEEVAKRSKHYTSLANWIVNNLRAKLSETHIQLYDLPFSSDALSELILLIENNTISRHIAQIIFDAMFLSGKDPSILIKEKGLSQVSDMSVIEGFCEQAIVKNPKSVRDFRAGKKAALNFLKGQVMRLSRGKANPNLVGNMLEKKISEGNDTQS